MTLYYRHICSIQGYDVLDEDQQEELLEIVHERFSHPAGSRGSGPILVLKRKSEAVYEYSDDDYGIYEDKKPKAKKQKAAAATPKKKTATPKVPTPAKSAGKGKGRKKKVVISDDSDDENGLIQSYV